MTDAQRAVQIALSYAQEAQQHIRADNYAEALENVGLAARQMNKVQDNGEKYDFVHETGEEREVTAAKVRAHILQLEGTALGLLGKHQKGVKALERAIQYDPTNGHLHMILAQLHVGCGNKKAAVRAATKAAELDPNDIEIAKETDRIINQSGAALRIGTFTGSVKTLLFLFVAGALCLGVMISVVSTEGGSSAWGLLFWVAVFWGSAWWYWRRKRGR